MPSRLPVVAAASLALVSCSRPAARPQGCAPGVRDVATTPLPSGSAWEVPWSADGCLRLAREGDRFTVFTALGDGGTQLIYLGQRARDAVGWAAVLRAPFSPAPLPAQYDDFGWRHQEWRTDAGVLERRFDPASHSVEEVRGGVAQTVVLPRFVEDRDPGRPARTHPEY